MENLISKYMSDAQFERMWSGGEHLLLMMAQFNAQERKRERDREIGGISLL